MNTFIDYEVTEYSLDDYPKMPEVAKGVAEQVFSAVNANSSATAYFAAYLEKDFDGLRKAVEAFLNHVKQVAKEKRDMETGWEYEPISAKFNSLIQRACKQLGGKYVRKDADGHAKAKYGLSSNKKTGYVKFGIIVNTRSKGMQAKFTGGDRTTAKRIAKVRQDSKADALRIAAELLAVAGFTDKDVPKLAAEIAKIRKVVK